MRRICVFDVNETLLDLRALDPLFEELFGSSDVRSAWFAQVLQSALVATVTEMYSDFGQIGKAALVMMARKLHTDVPEGGAEAVAAAMRTLPPHPDVHEGIARLKAAGYRLASLTNSPPAVVEAQLRNAGIAEHLELMLSADAVQRLKPAREPYLMAADRLRARPEELRLVAAHAWDVTGAIRAGCAAAFVARPGMVLDPLGEVPDVVGPDLPTIADEVIRIEG
jgi:2-haloacid dehalogenase